MTNRPPVSFYSREIETPEELAAFISELSGPLLPGDLTLLLAPISRGGKAWWQTQVVQEAVRNTSFADERLAIIIGLFASTSIVPEQRRGLDSLFTKANREFLKDNLAKILWKLHFQGVLDVQKVLLPKMRWYSSPDLWRIAVWTLRICVPTVLASKSMLLMIAFKSPASRLLLEITAADYATESSIAQKRFQSAIRKLSRLEDKENRKLMRAVFYVCLYGSQGLACAIVRQLIQIGDFRALDEITPVFVKSRELANLEVLSLIASTPNKTAADWATSWLEFVRRDSEATGMQNQVA